MTVKALTPGQQEPFFQLVRYQMKSGMEYTFTVTEFETTVRMRGGGLCDPLVNVTPGIVRVWAENSYVSLSEDETAASFRQARYGTGPNPVILSFALRKEAIDYEKFMGYPAIWRSVITLSNKLVEDVPSLIWGIAGGLVGGIGSGIGTALFLKWLGIK